MSKYQASTAEELPKEARLRPKRPHSRGVVNLRIERNLLSTKARYLRELAVAFVDELVTELEALAADQDVIEGRLSLRDEVRHFEIDLIKRALQQAGGSQTRAASLLGVRPTTLNSKIKLYCLQPKHFRRITQTDSPIRVVSKIARPALAKAITEDRTVQNSLNVVSEKA